MRKIPKTYKPMQPKKYFLLTVLPKESDDGESRCMWHGCDKISKVSGMGGGGS